MILLQVSLGPGAVASLHRRLTVVTGLEPARRPALADALAAALNGEAVDIELIAEVDGRRSALTPGLAERLGLEGVGEIAVLRSGMLPGASAPGPAAAPGPDGPGQVSGPQDPADDLAIHQLEARRANLVARLAEIGPPVDTAAVEQALADVVSQQAGGGLPPAGGMELAGRCAAYRGRDSEPAIRAEAPPAVADLTLTALERAGEALFQARAEMGRLDQRQVHALEAAHREVLEAERQVAEESDDQAERRLLCARATETQALDALGLASYEEYARALLGSLERLASAASAAVTEALAAYEGRSAWPPPPSPAGVALGAEGREAPSEPVEPVAVDPGHDELDDALPSIVDPRPEAGRARQALAQALRSAGVEEPGPHLEEAARAWLAAAQEVPLARARLEAELAEAERRTVSLGGLANTVDAPGADHAAAADAAAADSPAADGAAAGTPTGGPPAAGTSAALCLEAEVLLLARIVALGAMGAAGPVPLVIDDALAGFPDDQAERLLRLLDRMSGSVQVVYLGDDERVLAWAWSVGPERAAVAAVGDPRGEARGAGGGRLRWPAGKKA